MHEETSVLRFDEDLYTEKRERERWSTFVVQISIESVK